jgi:hypothetical protein
LLPLPRRVLWSYALWYSRRHTPRRQRHGTRRTSQQRQSHSLSTQEQPLSPTFHTFSPTPICPLTLTRPELLISLATPSEPPRHAQRTLPLSRASAATRTRISDSSDTEGDTASTSWVASVVAAVSGYARELRVRRLLMMLYSRWTEEEELVRAALAGERARGSCRSPAIPRK